MPLRITRELSGTPHPARVPGDGVLRFGVRSEGAPVRATVRYTIDDVVNVWFRTPQGRVKGFDADMGEVLPSDRDRWDAVRYERGPGVEPVDRSFRVNAHVAEVGGLSVDTEVFLVIAP